MKLFRRIWLLVFGLAGAIAVLGREAISGTLGLPAQNGPWIITVAGITLIALAIAPRFLFRR
jgi:hypothetical protein